MDIAELHKYTSELEQRWQKAGGQGRMELEGDGDGGGHRQRQERKGGRSYHDITPLLCHYISEQCSSSSMLRVARGGQSGGRGGMWGVRVSEVEFLNYCWGMDS